MDIDVERLDRVGLAVRDAILRCQMENDIAALVQHVGRGIPDITAVKLDPIRDLLADTVGQVVDPDHTMPLGHESLSQVTADETGYAGDEEGRHVITYSATCASV